MSNKKNILSNIIISLIIGVIMGALLVVLAALLDVDALIYWALVAVGIITVIANIPSLINGIMNIKEASGIIDTVFAIVGIALGCMMIFMHGTVIAILVSVYLIAFPIIRIFLSRSAWKDQIKKEWVRILIGALLLTFLPALLDAAESVVTLILLIAGWVVIAVSVLLFVLSLVSYISEAKKEKENAPIETTAEETSSESAE